MRKEGSRYISLIEIVREGRSSTEECQQSSLDAEEIIGTLDNMCRVDAD